MSLEVTAQRINARLATVMDSLFAIGLGLSVRYVIDIVSHHDSKVTGTLVGMWEGVVLSHFLKKMPKSFDPFIAYGVRLFIDFLYSGSIARFILVVVWTGLGVILADIVPVIWVDVGLRRIWRRFRRDLYYMTRSMRKIDLFPRARTVRFSPAHTTSVLSDSESTVTPSVVSAILPPTPARLPSRRHVPGSYESDAETMTEIGSTRIRHRDLQPLGSHSILPRRRLSTYPIIAHVLGDSMSEATSIVLDVDEGNISSSESEKLSEDLSVANPNEIPDEADLEYVDAKHVDVGVGGDGTPRQRPINLGLPTPTDSTHPFEQMRQENDHVQPPPTADIMVIPDTYDTGPYDEWENINQGDLPPSDEGGNPPPVPEKHEEGSKEQTPSPPPQHVPPPANLRLREPPMVQNQTSVENATAMQGTAPENVNASKSRQHVSHDALDAENPPPYQEPYDNQKFGVDRTTEKEAGADLHHQVESAVNDLPISASHLTSVAPDQAQASERPLTTGEEQTNLEGGGEPDNRPNSPDVNDVDLKLDGLSRLEQLVQLHKLIKETKSDLDAAAKRHGFVRTSGNATLTNDAKAHSEKLERKYTILKHRAEACYLMNHESGGKFMSEVDLSKVKDQEMEKLVETSLEQFLRPHIVQTSMKFLVAKAKQGAPQKIFIHSLLSRLDIFYRQETGNGRLIIVEK
ncbi:hypothetical protein AX17_005722 [Amanita inopinata Kibby_2008]|nr:hypothetical protein AX17_005722 [Amanita inopinata Kibby_2008]